jgi:hypothetical protein
VDAKTGTSTESKALRTEKWRIENLLQQRSYIFEMGRCISTCTRSGEQCILDTKPVQSTRMPIMYLTPILPSSPRPIKQAEPRKGIRGIDINADLNANTPGIETPKHPGFMFIRKYTRTCVHTVSHAPFYA